ncbi:hypothetical protein B7P43_G06408 [Cryptotermes secundus]|uniref:Uncharacterized protein n=1 Tax=Cryptotermes secundus TaxID=105785 RepID=A0A2J7QBU0_9NEOP|nr:hypothetical protein B7P43_G06408 [Cryptotermes secundus]
MKMSFITSEHINVSWNIFQDGLTRCFVAEPDTFPVFLNNHHFVWMELKVYV